jgi:hypothetical protein
MSSSTKHPTNHQRVTSFFTNAPRIDGHLACGPAARTEERCFGPAQARHDPQSTVPGLARPTSCASVWAATPARRAARPDMVGTVPARWGLHNPTHIYNEHQTLPSRSSLPIRFPCSRRLQSSRPHRGLPPLFPCRIVRYPVAIGRLPREGAATSPPLRRRPPSLTLSAAAASRAWGQRRWRDTVACPEAVACRAA